MISPRMGKRERRTRFPTKRASGFVTVMMPYFYSESIIWRAKYQQTGANSASASHSELLEQRFSERSVLMHVQRKNKRCPFKVLWLFFPFKYVSGYPFISFLSS